MTANFLEQDQRLKNMMCIICQKPDVHACKVAFKEAAKTMLSVAQKWQNFFIWLNTITHADDAIANDILYQNLWKIMPKRWQILNC